MRITNKSTLTGVVGLTTTAMAALILAVPGSAGAAPVPISAIDKYEMYLSDKSKAGDTGAGTVLSGFRALSEDKKEKFVDYIDNPEVGKAFAEAMSGDNGGEEDFKTVQKKELYGGDVVIESEYGVEDLGDSGGMSAMGATAAQGTAGDKKAWHSVSDTVFGVKVTKVTVGVNYRSSTTRTTKVYSGWAGHHNYVPFSEFEHSPVQKWISGDPGNNAHAETVWKGKLAGGGFTWSCRQRVWADQDGFKGGYLKRI